MVGTEKVGKDDVGKGLVGKAVVGKVAVRRKLLGGCLGGTSGKELVGK